MNRKQFAETVANAFIDQYCDDGSPVMNQPAVDYDITTKTFAWGSSLNPPSDNEIRVLELEDGMFGDYDHADPEGTRDGIRDFLTNYNDDLWNDVVSTIENADDKS